MRAQTAEPAWRGRGITWLKARWLSLLVHGVAWLPLLGLVWRAWNDDLGADPVNTINNLTGRTAILLLLASLAATPANILLGFRQALTVNRALGLYAFLYAALHFLNFIGLDYALNIGQALQDGVLEKPYIFVGLTALLLLIPLALTSTRGWMRRLGKNWKRLHRLVYPIGVLVAFHFLWQAKAAEKLEPVLYGIALLFLLFVRVPPVRRWIVTTRTRLTRPRETVTPARTTQAKRIA